MEKPCPAKWRAFDILFQLNHPDISRRFGIFIGDLVIPRRHGKIFAHRDADAARGQQPTGQSAAELDF